MNNDINELIEAIARIDDRLNKHELTTQKEIKVWSQTNLELMSIINRQGTAIEAFGETATQMAQLWQQSANWEERSKPEQSELMQEQRNLLEKQQQWQTACDEGVMGLTENLTKEIQGVKGQIETIQKTVTEIPKNQPQMAISASMQKELEIIKTAIAAVSTGKAIDYTKMEIPKKEGLIKEWSGKVFSFKINGILVSALLIGSLIGGFMIKQQETFGAFGGEDRYHIGRMLVSKYSSNGEKLKKCFDDKQKECQLQIADQKEEPGVKKGKKKAP